MFEKIYNSKIFGYIKLTYIFFLMIYCFGHHSPYTYRLFNATVFEILIIIFTICIVVPDLCNLKAYLKVKHFKWIIALLSCITISNLLNFRGGGHHWECTILFLDICIWARDLSDVCQKEQRRKLECTILN